MLKKFVLCIVILFAIEPAYACEALAESSAAPPSCKQVIIRAATLEDFPEMWEIFHAVVERGDTYVFAVNTCFEEARNYYWQTKGLFNFVACLDTKIVGMYTIKPNQPGLGSHVANGSYMVHPDFQGKKIGYTMAIHSLAKAKELGFRAMQFNMVVSTNKQAVNLWKKVGFSIIGTVPKVFQHQKLGYVDAYIMHRFLE